MKLKRLTSPSVEPITVSEAKDHLKVRTTGEDTVIGFELTAAREFLEHEMGVQMITCSYEGYLDSFPDENYIEFPLQPITGVVKVEYFAPDASSMSELSSDYYIFDDVRKPPRLYLHPDYSWPSTEPRVNAVKVTFNAGYNSADDVPEKWKQALKMMTMNMHEHRGDEGLVTLPKTIHDLINYDILRTV